MSSCTLTLTGKSHELSYDFLEPLDLTDDNYDIGLINFHTYNSIPNVDEANNKFYYDGKTVTLPVGSYEIDDINKYLRVVLGDPHSEDIHLVKRTTEENLFTLRANNNTLKCELISSCEIDFTPGDSIGALLGFAKKKLKPHELHVSDHTVNIVKVNSIQIECNIATGAYRNDKLVHTLHEFFPSVPPGYKIIEVPRNIIYLPVNVRTVNNVSLKICDQDGDFVNFRDEIITVRLHLRKNGH